MNIDIYKILRTVDQKTAYGFAAYCVKYIAEKKLPMYKFYFGGYTEFHEMLRKFVVERYSSTAVYKDELHCRLAWNDCGGYRYIAWLASNVANQNGMSREEQAQWIADRMAA